MRLVAAGLLSLATAGLMGTPTRDVGGAVDKFREAATDCMDASRCFDYCARHFAPNVKGLPSLARVFGFQTPEEVTSAAILCRHVPSNTAFLVSESSSIEDVGILEGFQLALVLQGNPPMSVKYGLIFKLDSAGRVVHLVDVEPRHWPPKVLATGAGATGVLEEVMLPFWAKFHFSSPFVGRLAKNTTTLDSVYGFIRGNEVSILHEFTPVPWSVSSLANLLEGALNSSPTDLWVLVPLVACLVLLLFGISKDAPCEVDQAARSLRLCGLLDDTPQLSSRRRFNTEICRPQSWYCLLTDAEADIPVDASHSSPVEDVADF